MKFSMTSRLERIVCCAVWVFGVLFSLYSFCLTAHGKVQVLESSDFSEGWSVLNQKKDVSDIEWVILISAFRRYWILLAIQIFVTQLVLPIFYEKQVLSLFYALYSSTCLLLVIGPHVFAVFFTYILIICFTHIFGRKSLCYLVSMLSLYFLQLGQWLNIREYYVQDKIDAFLTDVGLVWLVARCLSFSIDRIDEQSHSKINRKQFCLIVSYCLYLPTIFSGPLLNYQEFVNQINYSHSRWTMKKLGGLALDVIRSVSYYFVMEFLLHYVYSSAIQFYPEIVVKFSAWSLCGLGYALPILFYMKYFVVYNLAGCISRMEHFDFPPPPKCISHVHLPSVLWRTFDKGLYLWILKYLYFPIVNGRFTVIRKFVALAISFGFVCVWHGMDEAVCAWTFLNFIGASFEVAVTFLMSTNSFQRHMSTLSLANQERLKSVTATPQFMLMCISSTFFLSNYDIGKLIFQKIIFGGVIPLIPTAAIMYCGCVVAYSVSKNDKMRTKIVGELP